MATFSSYPEVDFCEHLKLLAGDPGRSEVVRTSGTSLVDYLNKNLTLNQEAVLGFRTTDSVISENLDIGKIIYTTGGSVPDDGQGGPYLVVAAGEGDIPLANGNELLLLPFGSLTGSDVSGALVTWVGGTDTVAEAFNEQQTALSQRVIYVGSVADLLDIANPVDGQEASVAGVPFKYDGAEWVPSEGYVNLRIYGATGSGTETAEVQAALDSGYEIRDTGTFTVSEIIPPSGCVINGAEGSPIILKLAADGKLCTLQNPNLSISNVIFDCDNINLTQPFPVQIMPGTLRPKLKNVTFRNVIGGTPSAQVQNAYGLLCDLNGVKGFEFENLTFENIRNHGDGLATFNGFTGGLWFHNTGFAAITPQNVSSGKVAGVACQGIFTIYPVGATLSEKRADNDADGIRFFSDPQITSADGITITGVKTAAVGKRAIKMSGVSGITVDGVYCNGSTPPDTDVNMESIIKVDGKNTVTNLVGYFGDYPCSDAVQTQAATGSIITNVLVDNAEFIVGESSSSSNTTIDNIRATVHGGLRLENITPQAGIKVDNAHLIFDRTGRRASDTNRRGASFINCPGITIGKITLNNGQLYLTQSPGASYESITIDWTSTVNPTTTNMGAQEMVRVDGDDVVGGSLSLRIIDSFPSYLSADQAVARVGLGDRQSLQSIFVKSANNNPLQHWRATNQSVGTITLDSPQQHCIGENDANPVSGLNIQMLRILDPACRIRFVRTSSDVFVGKTIKRQSDGANLTQFSNQTISDIYFERVFWRAGAGVVSPTSAITVIDERVLS